MSLLCNSAFKRCDILACFSCAKNGGVESDFSSSFTLAMVVLYRNKMLLLQNKKFLSSVVVVFLLLFSLGQADDIADRPIDSSFESLLVAQQDDTFSSISLRELGTLQLARQLAEYNQLSLNTVFSAGQEIRFPSQITPKSNYAIVSYVKGAATYFPAQSQQWKRALVRDDKLFTTDVVETGLDGFVSLELSSGAVINIQPDSKIRLEKLHCLPDDSTCLVIVDIESGKIRSNVTKREQQTNRFTIQTPYASAAVRGTVFDIYAEDDRLQMGVTEGDVGVDTDTTQLEVSTGFGLLLSGGDIQGPLTPLLDKPVLGKLPPRLTDEDRVIWRGVEGSDFYKVSYANDPEGREIISEVEVNGRAHTSEPLEIGDYYVVVRAIDPIGFLGFGQRSVFTKVPFDRTSEPPVIQGELQETTLFLSAQRGEGNRSHEFQLGDDAEFFNLVSVDVPSDGGLTHQLIPNQEHFVRARVINADGSAGPYSPVSIIRSDGSLVKAP